MASAPGTLRDRFIAFLVESHPFALEAALGAFDRAVTLRHPVSAEAIEASRQPLKAALGAPGPPPAALLPDGLETPPGVSGRARLTQATADLAASCDGFLRREAIQASLTADERR